MLNIQQSEFKDLYMDLNSTNLSNLSFIKESWTTLKNHFSQEDMKRVESSLLSSWKKPHAYYDIELSKFIVENFQHDLWPKYIHDINQFPDSFIEYMKIKSEKKHDFLDSQIVIRPNTYRQIGTTIPEKTFLAESIDSFFHLDAYRPSIENSLAFLKEIPPNAFKEEYFNPTGSYTLKRIFEIYSINDTEFLQLFLNKMSEANISQEQKSILINSSSPLIKNLLAGDTELVESLSTASPNNLLDNDLLQTLTSSNLLKSLFNNSYNFSTVMSEILERIEQNTFTPKLEFIDNESLHSIKGLYELDVNNALTHVIAKVISSNSCPELSQLLNSKDSTSDSFFDRFVDYNFAKTLLLDTKSERITALEKILPELQSLISQGIEPIVSNYSDFSKSFNTVVQGNSEIIQKIQEKNSDKLSNIPEHILESILALDIAPKKVLQFLEIIENNYSLDPQKLKQQDTLVERTEKLQELWETVLEQVKSLDIKHKFKP